MEKENMRNTVLILIMMIVGLSVFIKSDSSAQTVVLRGENYGYVPKYIDAQAPDNHIYYSIDTDVLKYKDEDGNTYSLY